MIKKYSPNLFFQKNIVPLPRIISVFNLFFMAQKKESHAEERLVSIEQGLDKAEVFITEHRQKLIYGVLAIIIVVAAWFGYANWVKEPREEKAQSELFIAQQMFEQDSLRLALEGDGSFLGFIDVADTYGRTAAGNVACFYAGLSYLHLGQYEEALTYLKRYSGHGLLGKALALGNIGDAYSELGDLDEALSYYKKAAKASDNMLTSPRFLAKAALVLEQQGNYADAIGLYERIQAEYANSSESSDADKRIARAKILSNHADAQ